MRSIYEQSDPTWSRDITTATPKPLQKSSSMRPRFPAYVVFALSTAVAGAAEGPPPFALVAESSSARYYVDEHPGAFSAHQLRKTWAATMKLVRDLGDDPDDLIRRASETVDHWRLNPDKDDYSDGIDLEEDEHLE